MAAQYPQYDFYVVDRLGQIVSGWENSLDADDAIEEIIREWPNAEVRTLHARTVAQRLGRPPVDSDWLDHPIRQLARESTAKGVASDLWNLVDEGPGSYKSDLHEAFQVQFLLEREGAAAARMADNGYADEWARGLRAHGGDQAAFERAISSNIDRRYAANKASWLEDFIFDPSATTSRVLADMPDGSIDREVMEFMIEKAILDGDLPEETAREIARTVLPSSPPLEGRNLLDTPRLEGLGLGRSGSRVASEATEEAFEGAAKKGARRGARGLLKVLGPLGFAADLAWPSPVEAGTIPPGEPGSSEYDARMRRREAGLRSARLPQGALSLPGSEEYYGMSEEEALGGGMPLDPERPRYSRLGPIPTE